MNRVAALAAFAVAVVALAAPLAALLSAGSAAAGVAVVVVVAFVVAALARRRDQTDASGSVWEFVPSWQYGGRHVESGGLTRDEQEQALREVREQAAQRAAADAEARNGGSDAE
jgi:hypothetical protein